ncbi:hypothetical protein C0995_013228 [Termitomyces sp. Mi166|nr:hypothetical protein C0995_013228 [Termitomyces sp. Mi166\
MPPCMERVGDYQSAMHPTQYQASIPEWTGKGNIATSEMKQVWYAPQAESSKGMSGQQPLIGHGSLASGQVEQPVQESSDEEENDRSKSTLSVQLKLVLNCFSVVTKESMQKHLQLYVVKHMQMLANMGQHVPEVDLTEYIELYTRIFELELEEYMKRKEARATTRSTATLADSVDYDAIRRQQVPVIAEAMDVLNAPQQVEESQQDFKRVPLRALSEVETTTSKIVDEEELEILQLPQMPRRHITIKEEVLERNVPADAESSQVIVRRIPMVESWNEHVNYQRMCNHDLRH